MSPFGPLSVISLLRGNWIAFGCEPDVRTLTEATKAARTTLSHHSTDSRVASVAPTTLVHATAWN